MKFSKIVFVLLLLAVQSANAQDTIVISAKLFNKFPRRLTLDNKNGWIFRSGNDSGWSKPVIDTSGWIKMKPSDLSKKYADKNGRIECWFRIKVKFDSSLQNKKMWISSAVWSATDLYMDGRLISKGGNTGNNGKPFEEDNGDFDPLSIIFNSDTVHTFAIHFVGYLSPFPPHDLKYHSVGDLLLFSGPNPATNSLKFTLLVYSFFYLWVIVCGVLSLLFWLLAFQNPREKNLVWIAFCTSVYTILNFFEVKINAIGIHYIQFYVYGLITRFSISLLIFIIIPLLLIKVFKRKPSNKLILLLAGLFLLDYFFHFFDSSHIGIKVITTISILCALGVCGYYIATSWKKLKGAQWAIVAGLFFSLFSIFAGNFYSLIIGFNSIYLTFTILSCFILSFPLSLLVYVSIRFKEMIQEVRINAARVVQLAEEKRAQAENQQIILQEEVTNQTAEIRQTLNNLRATQTQLIQSEKMASLGELTAGIAHEIQNPLNFVNNFSEVNKEMLEELNAERSKPKDERDDALEGAILKDVIANEEKINHHGKRADAIVKSMLQHSRQTSGKKEPTDINALCDEYLRLSYHGMRARDKSFEADFKTDFDNSIGKINIVPQDIGRVLLNLFNNAFYAVNEQKKRNSISYEPRVSIITKKNEDSVTITVTDNGAGIPGNIREKIFQPFFTTKPTGSGTGLGLCLSYDIIKAHGGEIRVESGEGEARADDPVGQGTTFIIQLPITA